MNLLHRIGFYWRLTEGRLLWLLLLDVLAAGFQGLAAAAMLTVLTMSSSEGGNFITAGSRWVMDFLGIASDQGRLLFLLTFCCAAFFAGAAAMVGSNWFAAELEARIRLRLQHGLAGDIFRSDYESFLAKGVGFYFNAIFTEMHKVTVSFKFFTQIFMNALFSGLFLAMAGFTNPGLILVVVLCGIPLFLALRRLNAGAKEFAIKNTAEYANLNNIVYQMLSNLKYLKATATWPAVLRELRRRAAVLAAVIKRQTILATLSDDGMKPFVVLGISGIIYFEVAFAGRTVVDALATMALLYAAYQKLMGVQSVYQKFLSSAGGILIYDALVKEFAAFRERVAAVGAPPDFSREIAFEKVSFTHGGAEKPLFSGLDLVVEPKTSVAFVGESGSGKSTLANLVTALLRPSEGQIRLGDTPYAKLDLDALRRGIGYVTQEAVVFNDTVFNNLTLWDASRSTAEVDSAVEAASAAEFVQGVPGGMSGMLGDNGANVSGGQRQRVNIARELIRSTPILILDEATSALDTATESAIQRNLDALHGEKTMILIAHRLSTIRRCDVIHVLHEGRIVESGSYDDLMALGGRFKAMADRQAAA